ncbi:MAG: GNAT family N-acetyltransferase [Acidobacteriota bacterium]|nr:MAG: GNAT family N-acetyltransferase [Acidobacteriota bacterium]
MPAISLNTTPPTQPKDRRNARQKDLALRVDLMDDPTQLEQLAEDWDRLAAQAVIPTVCLGFCWQAAWVEQFLTPGRELFVLVVRREGRIIGLAPWYRLRRRIIGLSLKELRPIGAPETASDYLDVLSAPGQQADVAAALYEHLHTRAASSWDLLSLEDIPADSAFAMHVMRRLDQDGRSFELEPRAYCPIARLPDDPELLLRGLSSNRREQFRRHRRLLEKRARLEQRAITDLDALAAEQLEALLEPLLRLHRRRWPEYDLRVYGFLSRVIARMRACGTRQTNEDLSASSRARLDYLLLDGREIGGLLHFDTQGRREMYLIGVDRDAHPRVSVGNVLVGMNLQQAVADGVGEYDFMKGVETYKLHWSQAGRRTLVLRLMRPRSVAVMAWWLVRQLKAGMRLVLR